MTKYVDPKIIQKELSKLTKNTNFYYSKAKESRIKNRKQHDLKKQIKLNQKNLSKDRFNEYLDSIYKAQDSTYKSDSTYKAKNDN